MPQPVRFTIMASAAEAVASIDKTSASFAQLKAAAKEASLSGQTQARLQIEQLVAQRREMRENIAVFKTYAATAVKGSEEQTAALKLARTEAQRLAATYLEVARAATRSGEAATVAATQSGRASKRAAEESGLLRGAASRSGIAGTGMAALAGPGFIAGAIIGGVVDYGVKAAMEEQKAQANLQNALRVTGNTRESVRKATERYIITEEKLTGFTRHDITQTLSQLIRSTGSLTKARSEEAIMANIARARNTDLAGAMMLVLKAGMGNAGALRRLGLDVQKTTTYVDELKKAHLTSNVALMAHAKALDLAATKTALMQAVTQKFGGASAAYMNTFAGASARLHNQIHDLFVEIGTKAIPILLNLWTWISKEITAAKESKTVHQLLHLAVVGLKDAWATLKTTVTLIFDVLKFLSQHVKTVLIPLLGVGLVLAIQAVNRGLMAMPWMAIITVAVIAIGALIRHWSAVSKFFRSLGTAILATFKFLWDELAKGAIWAALQIVEPFSHLPSVFGGWARKAKDALHAEYGNMAIDAAKQGAIIGNAFGQAYSISAAQAMAGGIATSPGQLKRVGSGSITATNGMSMIASSILSSGHGFVAETPGGSIKLPGGIGQGGGSMAALAAAHAIGIQYSWGGGGSRGPSYGTAQGAHTIGFDCSGLAMYALAQVGVTNVPHSSQEQFAKAPYHPPIGELKPGDLVFYEGPHPGHVAIYIGGGKVVHAPHTGETVQIASVNMMKITGTGRWWGGKDQGATTTADTTPVPTIPTIATTYTPADLARDMKNAPRKGKKGPKGLTEASLITARAGVTALLATVPAETDAIEKNAIKHIKELTASLHIGESAADVATTRASIKRWGKVLTTEIQAVKKEATKVAAAAAKEFTQQWASATSQVTKEFDKTTQRHIKQMQDAFQDQMREFDRETQRGLLARAAPLETPEEAALRQFRLQRQAAADVVAAGQRQSDLAAAIASGDPVAIKQAQDAIDQAMLDQQDATMQAAADISRTNAATLSQQQQDAYQLERDNLKQSLQDQETDRETAYQDLRDGQRVYLEQDLLDWKTAIDEKKKTYKQFLKWLADNGFGQPIQTTDPFGGIDGGSGPGGGSVTGSFADSPAWQGQPIGLGKIGFMAKGGDFMVRRPTLFVAGEAGPERATFTPAGSSASGHGGGGGGTVIIENLHVLGTTEREVANALARIVSPAQARQIGFTRV